MQLDELGETLMRAISARMEQARRTLEENGYAPVREIVTSAREAFDQARLSKGRYSLPSYDKGRETVTVPVTGGIEAEADPWDKLSSDGRKKAQELYNTCERRMYAVGSAQLVHWSSLRAAWLNTLGDMLRRIGNLDSDNKIQGISNSLTDYYTNGIAMNVVKFREEWRTVEKRYFEEHRWLLSQKSTDATEAAKRIEKLYNQAKGYLDRGAINFITEEDYFDLREELDKHKHIALGILRGSRIRAKKLKDMMDVVADLRRDGKDAEKYVPDWSRRLLEETDHLDALSKSTGEDFAPESLAEFSNLRNELLEKMEEAIKAHPPEKSILEKGAEFVEGGVEAVTGIFVEAAKQAWDLVQIELHYRTFGKYEPEFTSDLAKAAEQGATTSELLKGMVTGIIETPSRFLKACEDGDWKVIGRETLNLYFLAKTLKESPAQVKNLSKTAVATTKRALRILRARTAALEIEASLLPPAPTAKPKVLTTSAGAAGEAAPAGKVPKPGAVAPERTTTKVEAEAQKGIARLLEHFTPADVKKLGEFLSENKIALNDAHVDAFIQKVPRGKMGEYVRHLEIAQVHGQATESLGWPAEEPTLEKTTTVHPGKPPRTREIVETPGSKVLRANLIKRFKEEPPPDYHAHHIIPEKQFGEGLDWMRERLRKAGSDIHEADNGAFLAARGGTGRVRGATPNPELTQLHNSYIHAGPSKEYAYTLTRRLGNLHGSKFLDELRNIAEEMQTGRFKIDEIPYGWKSKWKPGMTAPIEPGFEPGLLEE